MTEPLSDLKRSNFDDPAGQINLYDKHPDKVTQLLGELNRIRRASSTRWKYDMTKKLNMKRRMPNGTYVGVSGLSVK